MITIRPATLEDMTAIDGQPPPRTCRAHAAIEDGKVVAVWGIYPINTRFLLFSSLSDEFLARRRNVVLGIAAVWKLLADRPRLPVLAIADPEIKGSDVLVRHMGFDHLHGDVWQLDRGVA